MRLVSSPDSTYQHHALWHPVPVHGGMTTSRGNRSVTRSPRDGIFPQLVHPSALLPFPTYLRLLILNPGSPDITFTNHNPQFCMVTADGTVVLHPEGTKESPGEPQPSKHPASAHFARVQIQILCTRTLEHPEVRDLGVPVEKYWHSWVLGPVPSQGCLRTWSAHSLTGQTDEMGVAHVDTRNCPGPSPSKGLLVWHLLKLDGKWLSALDIVSNTRT